jgi:hypothetical protein
LAGADDGKTESPFDAARVRGFRKYSVAIAVEVRSEMISRLVALCFDANDPL